MATLLEARSLDAPLVDYSDTPELVDGDTEKPLTSLETFGPS